MESLKLYREIEEKIAICAEECERDREDSYLSIIRNSELETLRALYERLKNGMSKEELLPELSRRILELEEAKEWEEEHPTFDWYDEHYHYKVLEGQCAAYRSVEELLKAGTDLKCRDTGNMEGNIEEKNIRQERKHDT